MISENEDLNIYANAKNTWERTGEVTISL